MKPMNEKEIRETRFRVTCLNPHMDGALRLDSSFEKLCGHGHGMTLEEMNQNLIWEGKPYIRIRYCKYCYGEDTVGILDDTPQLLGWAILPPNSENPAFRLERLSEKGYGRFMEWLQEKKQI